MLNLEINERLADLYKDLITQLPRQKLSSWREGSLFAAICALLIEVFFGNLALEALLVFLAVLFVWPFPFMFYQKWQNRKESTPAAKTDPSAQAA